MPEVTKNNEPRPEIPYLEIVGTSGGKVSSARQKGTLDRVRLHEALDAILDAMDAPDESPVSFGYEASGNVAVVSGVNRFRQMHAGHTITTSPDE